MFGLEGSGFVVCLGLILFLIGLVMFYVRQRFADVDAKLNQVISIIPVMTQQIQLHEQELHPSMYHEDTPATPGPLGSIPEEPSKIDVSSSEGDESDSDTDSESDDESTDVKNIRLGSELPEAPATEHTKLLADDSSVKLVTMGVQEVEEIPDDSASSEEEATATSGTGSPDADVVEIAIPITSVPQNQSVDYSKLSVAALRQLVSERGLSSHSSKLNKTECISLLQ